MGHRGGIRVYRPSWTEEDKSDPTKRVLLRSKNWCYEFQFRNRAYKKAGFPTAAAARAAGEDRKTEVRAGLEDDWRKFTVLGLYELAKKRKGEWAEGTQKAFEVNWTRIRTVFPNGMFLVDVTADELSGAVTKWKSEGYASNTIRFTLETLKQGMTMAHESRRLPWVPKFPKLRYQRRDQTVHQIQLSQIVALMPKKYHLFFEAAQECGWRARSELRSRKWTSVDWGPSRWLCECEPALTIDADECSRCGAGRPGELAVDAESTKTRTARAFGMTKALRSILLRARIRCDQIRLATGVFPEWIFPNDDGSFLTHYQDHWEAALKKLGIGQLEGRTGPWSSKVVVHDVRRTAIRKWRKVFPRETTMPLAGHTSESAHAIYEEQGTDAATLRKTALLLDRVRDEEERRDEKIVQLSLWGSKNG